MEDVTQKDGSTVVCDDSCAWALDGVCDDGSRGPSANTQTHWWHRRRQKNGKEGTWKQTAEQAGYWMGLVAVALFILIGYAYHTKLSEEERKDKCAPCRAALLTVTNRDTAVMDEAEQALGLKASKD